MLQRFLFSVILMWSLVIPLHAQQRDTIMLYNGQVFIGKIKGAQMGVLTIDDVDMRFLNLKMYKIKSLSTHRRFRIETEGREIYYANLSTSERQGWVNIITDDSSSLPIPIVNLSLIVLLEKTFFSRVDGNLAVGFNYTKSSDIGLTNINLQAHYLGKKFEYQLSISFNGSIDSSEYSRDREDISLFGAYTASTSWFLAASLEYQRNLELSIARRYSQMVGGGNKLFVRHNWQFLVVSGITFNQERSTAGESSSLLLELPLILRFNFFKYRQPNMQISSTQSLFYGIAQNNRVRYSTNTSFSWELIKDFYFTMNPYVNYDSSPPEGGNTIDYGISFNLSYKF